MGTGDRRTDGGGAVQGRAGVAGGDANDGGPIGAAGVVVEDVAGGGAELGGGETVAVGHGRGDVVDDIDDEQAAIAGHAVFADDLDGERLEIDVAGRLVVPGRVLQRVGPAVAAVVFSDFQLSERRVDRAAAGDVLAVHANGLDVDIVEIREVELSAGDEVRGIGFAAIGQAGFEDRRAVVVEDPQRPLGIAEHRIGRVAQVDQGELGVRLLDDEIVDDRDRDRLRALARGEVQRTAHRRVVGAGGGAEIGHAVVDGNVLRPRRVVAAQRHGEHGFAVALADNDELDVDDRQVAARRVVVDDPRLQVLGEEVVVAAHGDVDGLDTLPDQVRVVRAGPVGPRLIGEVVEERDAELDGFRVRRPGEAELGQCQRGPRGDPGAVLVEGLPAAAAIGAVLHRNDEVVPVLGDERGQALRREAHGEHLVSGIDVRLEGCPILGLQITDQAVRDTELVVRRAFRHVFHGWDDLGLVEVQGLDLDDRVGGPVPDAVLELEGIERAGGDLLVADRVRVELDGAGACGGVENHLADLRLHAVEGGVGTGVVGQLDLHVGRVGHLLRRRVGEQARGVEGDLVVRRVVDVDGVGEVGDHTVAGDDHVVQARIEAVRVAARAFGQVIHRVLDVLQGNRLKHVLEAAVGAPVRVRLALAGKVDADMGQGVLDHDLARVCQVQGLARPGGRGAAVAVDFVVGEGVPGSLADIDAVRVGRLAVADEIGLQAIGQVAVGQVVIEGLQEDRRVLQVHGIGVGEVGTGHGKVVDEQDRVFRPGGVLRAELGDRDVTDLEDDAVACVVGEGAGSALVPGQAGAGDGAGAVEGDVLHAVDPVVRELGDLAALAYHDGDRGRVGGRAVIVLHRIGEGVGAGVVRVRGIGHLAGHRVDGDGAVLRLGDHGDGAGHEGAVRIGIVVENVNVDGRVLAGRGAVTLGDRGLVLRRRGRRRRRRGRWLRTVGDRERARPIGKGRAAGVAQVHEGVLVALLQVVLVGLHEDAGGRGARREGDRAAVRVVVGAGDRGAVRCCKGHGDRGVHGARQGERELRGLPLGDGDIADADGRRHRGEIVGDLDNPVAVSDDRVGRSREFEVEELGALLEIVGVGPDEDGLLGLPGGEAQGAADRVVVAAHGGGGAIGAREADSDRTVAGRGQGDRHRGGIALDDHGVADRQGRQLRWGRWWGGRLAGRGDVDADRGGGGDVAVRGDGGVGKRVLPGEARVGLVGHRAVLVDAGDAVLRRRDGADDGALDVVIVVEHGDGDRLLFRCGGGVRLELGADDGFTLLDERIGIRAGGVAKAAELGRVLADAGQADEAGAGVGAVRTGAGGGRLEHLGEVAVALEGGDHVVEGRVAQGRFIGAGGQLGEHVGLDADFGDVGNGNGLAIGKFQLDPAALGGDQGLALAERVTDLEFAQFALGVAGIGGAFDGGDGGNGSCGHGSVPRPVDCRCPRRDAGGLSVWLTGWGQAAGCASYFWAGWPGLASEL